MEEQGLGFGFYARMAGLVAVLGIAGLIVMLILTRAAYAWGVFGALALLAVVLLVFGWFYDRRQVKRYDEE